MRPQDHPAPTEVKIRLAGVKRGDVDSDCADVHRVSFRMGMRGMPIKPAGRRLARRAVSR
jgi:hypothetical protein